MTNPDQPRPERGDPDESRRLLEMALESLPPGSTQGAAAAGSELAKAFPNLEITGLIGQGGMGAVYKARDPKLDRFVALKVLRSDLPDDPTFAERFTREARAQASLNHPNILSVYDFGESQGHYFLVTEYVDGADLRQLMKMGKLSALEALRMVPQICDALQFAHSRGVVHRDIKPENILIDQQGHVQIADFGLAKILGGDDTARGMTLTRTEQALGTPHYMAPEQMMGAGGVDHRADIYSLGVVIYEMLTGQLPIGRFDPPSTAAGTGKALDEVVLRALAQAVDRRYQNISEVKTDVENAGPGVAAHEAGADVEQADNPSPPPAHAVPVAGGTSKLCKRPLVALLFLLVVPFVMGVLVKLTASDMEGRMASRMEMQAYQEEVKEMESWQQERNEPWPGEIPIKPEEHQGGLPFALWPFAGLLTMLSLVTVAWLGFSAVRRIKISNGALHGLGFALVIAWLPILIGIHCALTIPFVNLRDSDLALICMLVMSLILLILDFFFLRWQYRHHRSEIV